MRDVLVTLADGNVTGNQRAQYVAQYQSLLANVQSVIQDASYGGKTLIGNIAGSTGTMASRGNGAQRIRRHVRDRQHEWFGVVCWR